MTESRRKRLHWLFEVFHIVGKLMADVLNSRRHTFLRSNKTGVSVVITVPRLSRQKGSRSLKIDLLTPSSLCREQSVLSTDCFHLIGLNINDAEYCSLF